MQIHCKSDNRCIAILWSILFFLGQSFFPSNLFAGVVTDGTVGPQLALSGPNYLVPSTLGTLHGQNLFHSFDSFSIQQGESATFSGPATIVNVISRVTGGSTSNIDGLLRSQVGQADFYFINPAGMIFGPHADVDVPASFHVATADELRFVDGGVFSAIDPARSTLSVAPPESFGFLNSQSGSLVVNGSSMTFQSGSTVSLAAVNLELNDTLLDIPGGVLRLAAMGEVVGAVPFAGWLAGQGRGTLTTDYSTLRTSGDGGGSILVDGGNVRIDGTIVYTDNMGTGDAPGGVRISATDLKVDNSWVSADTLATGKAGSVYVDVAGALRIVNGGYIGSSTLGGGDAGTVHISAGSLWIDRGSSDNVTGILSNADAGSSGNAGGVMVTVAGEAAIMNGGEISSGTFSQGNAGMVGVSAASLRIDGGSNDYYTGISSQGNAGSSGDAGRVTVAVSGEIAILNGGKISSATYSQGNAGTVDITAGSLWVERGASDYMTGILSNADETSSGNAGSVTVAVSGEVAILHGGEISSGTDAQGNAGTVHVSSGSLWIERGVNDYNTGIFSNADSASSGNAGSVEVAVSGETVLVDGGKISSSAFAAGNAGTVSVFSGSLHIDGGSGEYTAGIMSDTNSGSSGNAGSVAVNVAGDAAILNGGQIRSDTFSQGNAGTVRVSAGNLRIDGGSSYSFTGVSSDANSGSSGNAGSVTVAVAGEAALVNGGKISSSTSSLGNASTVTVSAGTLRIDTGTSEYVAGIFSDADLESFGDAGSVIVTVAGEAAILNGGQIRSDTFSFGNAGMVRVAAGSLRIDEGESPEFTGISSDTNAGSGGNAGSVRVEVSGAAALLNGGKISSSTFSEGNAGMVDVSAGSLRIDGGSSGYNTGVLSNANSGSSGDAGSVRVAVTGETELENGGKISSYTSSMGNAGTVQVSAGILSIDGGISDSPTGIFSDANLASSGDAGSVTVVVSGAASLLNGGQIRSDTFSPGNAGTVHVSSGTLHIDAGTGYAFTGITSDTNYESIGDAGSVTVAVFGEAVLLNGGNISSSTYSVGNAGTVNVSAGNLRIDGGISDYVNGILSNANSDSGGDAGSVTVTVAGDAVLLNGGKIASSTYAEGNAGTVHVSTTHLRIDGENSYYATGILSDANWESSGNAGRVTVIASGDAALVNGGMISSYTSSEGNAGTVDVSAGNLLIDEGGTGSFTGVTSQANYYATGLVGDVLIQAGHVRLGNGGEISISNYGITSSERLTHFIPGHLRINAGTLEVSTGSSVNATSVGNTPASSIVVNIGERLTLSGESRITTEAMGSDGGAITVTGPGTVMLRDGQISTSTQGGRGGNIILSPGAMLMNTGFVQANTDAGASGGNILVDTPVLITPYAIPPQVGGNARQVFQAGSGLNVIQAAAPGGEQGEITITSPDLNISSALVGLTARLLEAVRLATDPCQTESGAKGSSLVFGGSGIPSGPEQPLAVCMWGEK